MERRSRVKTKVALLVCGAITLCGQAPSFEAASIKPGDPSESGSGWHSRPGYMVLQNQTLVGLIRIAYHLNEGQVTGGEKWALADRFMIEARANGPLDEKDMLPMLQTLLADRFQLKFHKEQKPFPGYALVIAKGGLKMQPVEPGSPGSSSRGSRERVQMEVRQAPMSRLADLLSRQLGMPVEDATGTTESFSFKLEYARLNLSANAAPSDDAGPTIFTALQDLGLKLEAKKIPQDVYVIDSAAKPQPD